MFLGQNGILMLRIVGWCLVMLLQAFIAYNLAEIKHLYLVNVVFLPKTVYMKQIQSVLVSFFTVSQNVVEF